MSDFLLELRSEEIPARMQPGARESLEKLLRKEMDAAGVTLGALTVWSSPRRLALIARDLPAATAAVSEEIKGPRAGAPPQALEGFLRKTGLTQDQLTTRDGVLYAVLEKPGRATAEVLAEAIPAIIRAFPWPKSQRWGAGSISTESLRWVRPLSGIIALLGEELINCEVAGIASGRTTLGHRFHSHGAVTITSAADYAEKLRAAHVIVDHAERQDLIRTGAAKAASDAGLVLVEDEGLVIENAGLTEWPVPLLGRFDEAFLDVPPEVIQLTARTNQKYFVCEADGKLANAFICTANIVASDGGAEVVAGNRKVLAARLSDARFFWEQDRKTSLADQAKKLERITFHEKLGTVADKVERVADLAEWLARKGIVPDCDPKLARHAAELCKADLVTAMVGEFAELQGLMGSYYAHFEGLDPQVAGAIRDHYKPVGQSDEVPTAPVTVAVSLADKIDTLSGFFAIDQTPSGSRDPFALRRAAFGVIREILENNLRFDLQLIVLLSLGLHARQWLKQFRLAAGKFDESTYSAWRSMKAAISQNKEIVTFENTPSLLKLLDTRLPESEETEAIFHFAIWKRQEITAFFGERLISQQREFGTRSDVISAVFGQAGEGDLVRLLARVHALQAFIGTEDGANLLAGYKRAANILKKEDFTGGEEIALSYEAEPAEKALIDALGAAGPKANAAVAAEDFAGAMAALASLRSAVDAFFESVTVNDADHQKRQFRLGLLAAFRDAVHGVADFSRIEG